ncbi:hypothetical protein NM688_g9269 [Phlebia brevispora]|uniref:Uncharacterized protein n=1 Tax=Phlebia brevispora TaxID=194682 RepID=A0ACC1RJG8_9APHY|nr:hypothetical protein NM688_g9269 [Phlebia brevispora]
MEIGPYTLQDMIRESQYALLRCAGVVLRSADAASLSSMVFKGIWSAKNVHVAVKFSRHSLEREWSIMRKLACPAGIPNAIEYLKHEGWEVLVMELAGLDFSLSESFPGVVPIVETTLIAALVIHRLEHIHNRGIIHSDIKPSNITYHLSQDKEDELDGPLISLIDFGLACIAYEHAHPEPIFSGVTIGSTPYMSPWVHRGYRPCRRDDLFSAAVTFIVLCKGVRQLPWFDMVYRDGEDTLTDEEHVHVASLKETADLHKLAHGKLPDIFIQFYQYVLALKHGDEPAYHTWFNKFLGTPDCDCNGILPIPPLMLPSP